MAVILLLDNRDSFVHNIAHALEGLGAEVRLERSTQIQLEQALALKPQGLVMGPGPGTPGEAGCSEAWVRHLVSGASPGPPALGICLGHQAIATALGGQLSTASQLLHGQPRFIEHTGSGLFQGLPSPVQLTGYNSLIVDESTLPAELEVCARNQQGEIEGLKHRTRPLFGIQAHPESFLCLEQTGRPLFEHFLHQCGIQSS